MQENEAEFVNIKGYHQTKICTRKQQSRGGSVLYIREDVSTYWCEVDFVKDESIEGQIEVSSVLCRSIELVLICIYRTPLGDPQIFLNKLDYILTHVINTFVNYKVLVCGDMNTNLLLSTDSIGN